MGRRRQLWEGLTEIKVNGKNMNYDIISKLALGSGLL
jgi:hypothetical protein